MLEAMKVNFLHGILAYSWVVFLCIWAEFYNAWVGLYHCVFDFVVILRDYSQDLDAILLAKPTRLTVEMLSMYQDHIARVISNNITDHDNDVAVDVEDAQDVVWKLYKLEIRINLY